MCATPGCYRRSPLPTHTVVRVNTHTPLQMSAITTVPRTGVVRARLNVRVPGTASGSTRAATVRPAASAGRDEQATVSPIARVALGVAASLCVLVGAKCGVCAGMASRGSRSRKNAAWRSTHWRPKRSRGAEEIFLIWCWREPRPIGTRVETAIAKWWLHKNRVKLLQRSLQVP